MRGVRKLLRRKAPKANITDIETITDLLEGHAMLEQTIERWFEEATLRGVQQGRQEGRQEGRLEGLARAIALQVQMRFGSVPPWVDARLQSATQDELLGWATGILTANSVQELFGQAGDAEGA